jgi:hypothetical protein
MVLGPAQPAPQNTYVPGPLEMGRHTKLIEEFKAKIKENKEKSEGKKWRSDSFKHCSLI